jgi:hypothetical protein
MDMSDVDDLPDLVMQLTITNGQVLVHNQVSPPSRVNASRGARWWLDAPSVKYEQCSCGWAPEIGDHYRVVGVEFTEHDLALIQGAEMAWQDFESWLEDLDDEDDEADHDHEIDEDLKEVMIDFGDIQWNGPVQELTDKQVAVMARQDLYRIRRTYYLGARMQLALNHPENVGAYVKIAKPYSIDDNAEKTLRLWRIEDWQEWRTDRLDRARADSLSADKIIATMQEAGVTTTGELFPEENKRAESAEKFAEWEAKHYAMRITVPELDYSCGGCGDCEHCVEELAEAAEAHRVADANSATVLPGEYFLGDPGSTFPGDQKAWDALLESCNFFEKPVGTAPDGMEVLAFSTAWGDGMYPDHEGNEYYVSSGLIGLVPVTPESEAAYAKLTEPQYIQRVKFDEPAYCKNVERNNNGRRMGTVMFFGHKRIWT